MGCANAQDVQVGTADSYHTHKDNIPLKEREGARSQTHECRA